MSAITVRVPDFNRRRWPKNDGMSVNQFFVTAVAEKLSALETEEYLKREAAKGTAARGLAILAKVPATVPEAGVELPGGCAFWSKKGVRSTSKGVKRCRSPRCP